MTSLWRRAAAEGVGTFVIVLAACGAQVVDGQTGALGHVGAALTSGLAVMVMIAAAGHISGAHFNPAVTLAFALTRHFEWRALPAYWGAQLLGATAAAATVRLLFGTGSDLGATLPFGSAWQSLGLEIILTAVLMYVITAVATDAQAVGAMAAIAIGATVALGSLWGGPVSGAAMNPARALGPALMAGVWQAHWVYWVGPLVGAAVGAATYQGLRTPPMTKAQPR